MNAAIESLLELADADLVPAAHTSSHWRHHGAATRVERRNGALLLRADGFEIMTRMSWRGRALHALERVSYLPVTRRLPEYSAIWRAAVRLSRDLRLHPNLLTLRSTCALAVLAGHWKTAGIGQPKTVALIGDGFGFLGALFRRVVPGARLYCIDLPKILIFQARLHQAADPSASLSLLSGAAGQPAEVTLVTPDAVERIGELIDCAVNMASFGEMTRQSVQGYFAFLRRRSHAGSRFYCINRLEKRLIGGEITRFDDYPWHPEDEIFLDGPCPYYTHFFASYMAPHGPRIGGVRLPCVNYFDGVLLHRLVRLAPLTDRGPEGASS